MKLETHIHTKFSHDSLMCFWALYVKCRLSKIDYIAVTEHNNILGAIEFQKYCKSRGDKVKVIVGEEIMTNCGEIIGLYLARPVEQGLPPDETINAIKAQGGIVYIPHPYDEKRKETVLDEEVIERNADKIDCIEIHNGRNISFEFSEKQKAIADKYGLRKVVGSDAHTVIEIGRNYMDVSLEPSNTEAFREALTYAELKKRDCIRISHYMTRFARFVKLVSKGDFHEIRRIIHRKFERKEQEVGRNSKL